MIATRTTPTKVWRGERAGSGGRGAAPGGCARAGGGRGGGGAERGGTGGGGDGAHRGHPFWAARALARRYTRLKARAIRIRMLLRAAPCPKSNSMKDIS